MTNLALERFIGPINDLQQILTKGRNQKEKGKSLYRNKGRDVLFRLEALCRVYREINDKKFFDTWYKKFKLLEDVLGEMDFNDAMHQEFSKYKELQKHSAKVFLSRFEEEANFLTETIQSGGWQNGSPLAEFNDGLQKVQWKTDEEDRAAFGLVMCQELDKLVSKYREGELDMFRLEEGIHEFRRKLRWVSIYAQAANGLVQLRAEKHIPEEVRKYCTSEVVESPFNVLAKNKAIKNPIYIQSHHFYAMSWMIKKLSVLKDDGFRFEMFKHLCESAGLRDKKLTEKFLKTCEINPDTISATADEIADRFIYVDIIPERIRRDIKRSLV